jgi:hypothetical protein
MAQNIAQYIFVKFHALPLTWKKYPSNLGYFCNFAETAQSKQSPIVRMLTQCGHSAYNASFFIFSKAVKTLKTVKNREKP